MIEFVAGYNVRDIYIDPSAASFKLELSRRGVRNVLDAENDVLAGIRFQAQLLAQGTYKICCQCVESIREYGTYLWDNRASERGIDRPVKMNDHISDAQRYALYTHFFRRIDQERGMNENDAEHMERAYRPSRY